ncbi:MAG: multiheme c-type cytochrome [Planctomycetota bacterium]
MHRNRRDRDATPWVAEQGLAGLALGVIAVAIGLRIGWLAVAGAGSVVENNAAPPTAALDPPALASTPALAASAGAVSPADMSPSSASAVVVPPCASESMAPPPRLTPTEAAMLSAMCPTALDAIPAEMLPVQPPPVAARAGDPAPIAGGRLTDLRVAARPTLAPAAALRLARAPTAPPDGWLVSPDDWFVPEDRPAVTPPTEAGAESVEDRAEDLDRPLDAAIVDDPLPQDLAPDDLPPDDPAFEGLPADESAAMEAEPNPPRLGPRETLPAPGASWEFERADPLRGDARESQTEALDNGPALGPAIERGPPTSPRPDKPVGPPTLRAPVSVRRPTASRGPLPDAMPKPLPEALPEPTRGRPRSSAPSVLSPSAAPSSAASSSAATESAARGEAVEPPSPPPLPQVRVDPAPAGRGSVQPAYPQPSPVRPGTVGPTTPDERSEPPEPARSTKPAKPLFPAPVGPGPATRPAPTPHGGLDAKKAAAEARDAADGKTADESHRELFAKNCYPSARDCAECHERIYNEWSVSSHAYAFVSPMFQKFEEKITQLSNGTIGHFCYRCHSPVGTAMGELRSTPIGELAEVALEGVTCIACHRVNQRYGKSNGERRLVPGDRYAPVYGGVGGDGVAKVIAEKDKYKVKTSDAEKGPGVGIHNEGRFFDQLTKAEACTSCHQVAVHPGVKLEVVWEQYRASPACKKGVTCQECHMGRVPGMAGGYNYGPVAEINGKTVNNHRKQSSHLFYGPGYSIAHPGIFPRHKDAANWTMNEWLTFDWRAGWGTDGFEDEVEAAEDRGLNTAAWFPPVWAEADDRYDAREVIDDNLERLKTKRRYREIVMENGSKVDGPFFRETPTVGRDMKFDFVVTNLNEGHNLPTASLGAQPQLWANVVLIGPDGRRLWETGYTDSNGDLCDIHSVDVRHGRVPFDKQLFNLQTMFLITGATGTDREFYLPVNLDIDQVAHLRPGTIPVSVTNHPPFIRMEMRSISPLGKKRVKYKVPKELVQQPGRYRLSFRLRSRTEPMYFMRLCEATPEMLRAMIEGTLDIHPYSVEFDVQ